MTSYTKTPLPLATLMLRAFDYSERGQHQIPAWVGVVDQVARVEAARLERGIPRASEGFAPV